MMVVVYAFAVIGVLLLPLVMYLFIRAYVECRQEEREYEENRARNKKIEEEMKKEELPVRFCPSITPSYITFKYDEPDFYPSFNDIIYYSLNEESEINGIVEELLPEIKDACAKKGRRFVYLPDFNKEELLEEKICYYNPCIPYNYGNRDSILTYHDIASAYHLPSDLVGPCLIRANYEARHIVVSICPIETSSPALFRLEVDYYLNHLKGYNNIFYSIKSINEIESEKEWLEKALAGRPADYRFKDDIYLIALEIKEKVEKLRSMGVSALSIRKLVGDVSRTPSPILIDKNYKITFTDFNNRELELSPVNKAVFLLFLNHPEGIYFKELPDYKNELLELYQAVTVHDDMEKVRATVERLTNPMDNSINEKCARIKNTLMLMFREEIASWYFIDGNRGEKKGIKLPRNLVTYEK